MTYHAAFTHFQNDRFSNDLFSSKEPRSRADEKRGNLFTQSPLKSSASSIRRTSHPRKTTRKASEPHWPIRNSKIITKVVTRACCPVTKQHPNAKPLAQQIQDMVMESICRAILWVLPIGLDYLSRTIINIHHPCLQRPLTFNGLYLSPVPHIILSITSTA